MWYSVILLGIICFVSLNAKIEKNYRGWPPLMADKVQFSMEERNLVNERHHPSVGFDLILMVPVAQGKFLTTAEIKYRHILYPEDQIVMGNPNEFAPKQISFEFKTKDRFFNRRITVHPQYGFLSHANNIALVEDIDLPLSEFAIIKKEKTALEYVNKVLTAYYSEHNKAKFAKKAVKVVDFKKCQEAFHVDNPHYLDDKEQICTENFRPVEGFLDLHNGMLFDESGLQKLFVGITSLSNDKYTLSTFVPYHCDHPLLDKFCS